MPTTKILGYRYADNRNGSGILRGLNTKVLTNKRPLNTASGRQRIKIWVCCLESWHPPIKYRLA